ncbi:TPA: phosphoglycerate mutase [Streptococcus equi subsp. zooepidemicus]|uniref:phosphoglycerate mutase n=1 Tax=Streptococcus equi TaxID=1336 RepID=UPI000DA2B28B|nr:phosphoglycerate mutase [Streptococcus equi]VED85300.1 2,3-bisphosphoglycerate-dependent phosphoglycerate mutase [Streptococcus equi subsp. equi]MCD3400674.1 phosphoglycerate mutase [Streptococcus equi subsp. zooepidemicus]MCD3413764.1 phosphoglycerate mutase [Streptococcus equi subsp. zooepidemicus]MCD3431238.1 phosphoglycerate mutase [Streptococcus equi subsp. zooepidemicus]QGM23275.1 phosphoglycerate mutase [Streptococcus equi subsp. zooepidemicus]
MQISKNWFIRFEPNFQTTQNTILFNKVSGELFEVTEVYYDCINSLRIGVDFQALLMEKYAVNAGDVIDVEDTILKNLISLGVIINE